MTEQRTRREFMRDIGISAAAAPFIMNLPSLGFAQTLHRPKQRLAIIFSPDGVIPDTFWPDETGGTFTLKESLKPLEPFKDRTLILNGVCNKVQGDGDGHMRGIGCLLTGDVLFPGNIQGGSDTPAGWASGISIDQEIKNFLQADKRTRTRFGSLEFGVLVPEKANTWTRMSYAGPNQPLTPIDNPYQMFDKLYGRMKDRKSVESVLHDLRWDMRRLRQRLSSRDRQLLEEHAQFVRDFHQELKTTNSRGGGALAQESGDVGHAVPELDPGVEEANDNMPRISKMQLDLLVDSFRSDFARIATLQYTKSVGQARMRWLGVDEGQHTLSHEPDGNKEARSKLTDINKWYCEQMAYLLRRLDETPEPDGSGTLLDHTTVLWTNELGKGNTHSHEDIPFVLAGGGLGFEMGRSLEFSNVYHNRLLLSLAHAFGHRLERFGLPKFCDQGPLSLT